MDWLNFLKDDPVMAWFAFLALLLIVVLAASALRQKMAGRSPTAVTKQSTQPTKPVRFGIHADLLIIFYGIVALLLGIQLLLGVISWIRSTFFE